MKFFKYLLPPRRGKSAIYFVEDDPSLMEKLGHKIDAPLPG
jgi:hypothetical protein